MLVGGGNIWREETVAGGRGKEKRGGKTTWNDDGDG
jgi:hypothetical protein